MALGFYFSPTSFTAADYDQLLGELEAAGAGTPAVRLYHVALETDGTALGADPGQPSVSKVHNIIQG